MLEIGSVVDGKYKILNEIGRGGMSIVYLAVNERANKPWAIKEVRKDSSTDFEVIRQSQIMETNLLKQLNHPHLPSIVDVIDQKDSFLIVMDYIEGKPLSDALEERTSLPCEDVIEWAKQLCDVLEYLHTRPRPIIYRDMKPSNIMLKSDGTVMLIDFGIAREYKRQNVADTTWLGTRGYAAPEQFGGQGQTDARTDIYCLGATMYHLITGHNPSEPPYEMYPIRYWNASFSSGLESIILKCTQQNPDDRYQSCAELLYALEHYREEDEGYKKIQNMRWHAFLLTTGLTVLTGVITLFCYAGMRNKTSSKYEEYLNTAALTVETDEKYRYYEQAIALAPTRGEAYEALLETMQSDGVFSEAESREIRKVMPAYMNLLAENTESYLQTAYELGIMYFYYYEGTEDIQNASKWLNIAIGNTVDSLEDADVDAILGEKKAFRARHLYQIMQYYRNLDNVNKEGDYDGDYAALWEDLSAVVTPQLAAEDNNVTELLLYNFMASQLVLHAKEYKMAGVEKGDMEQRISMIKKHVVYDEDNQYEELLYKKLQSNLEQAQKVLAITFGS